MKVLMRVQMRQGNSFRLHRMNLRCEFTLNISRVDPTAHCRNGELLP
jgi:hypothetical protein